MLITPFHLLPGWEESSAHCQCLVRSGDYKHNDDLDNKQDLQWWGYILMDYGYNISTPFSLGMMINYSGTQRSMEDSKSWECHVTIYGYLILCFTTGNVCQYHCMPCTRRYQYLFNLDMDCHNRILMYLCQCHFWRCFANKLMQVLSGDIKILWRMIRNKGGC